MSIGFLLAVIGGGAALISYCIYEKRSGQRACAECGSRVSVDAPSTDCPRCRNAAGVSSQPGLEAKPLWAKSVLIAIPVVVFLVDAVVLISERLDSDGEKAIRTVKESSSRKENFTVQQHLYSTIYHRADQGDHIQIAGWQAKQLSGDGSPILVEFGYKESGAARVAEWEVDLDSGKSTPLNQTASGLSWK